MLRSSLRHCAGAPRGKKNGALAQLVERLLCKQDVVGSTPSGSTKPRFARFGEAFRFLRLSAAPTGRLHRARHNRHDQQILVSGFARPVGRTDLRIHFTSFREIISVVGFIRVRMKWSDRPTAALSKSSTTNQMFSQRCESGKCTNVFDWKRPPRGNKRTAVRRAFGLSSSGSNQAR